MNEKAYAVICLTLKFYWAVSCHMVAYILSNLQSVLKTMWSFVITEYLWNTGDQMEMPQKLPTHVPGECQIRHISLLCLTQLSPWKEMCKLLSTWVCRWYGRKWEGCGRCSCRCSLRSSMTFHSLQAPPRGPQAPAYRWYTTQEPNCIGNWSAWHPGVVLQHQWGIGPGN